jgi:hypothetical protein
LGVNKMTEIPEWLKSLKNLVMDVRDNNERLPMIGGGLGELVGSLQRELDELMND